MWYLALVNRIRKSQGHRKKLDKEREMMELEFEKRNCHYMDQILRDNRTEELTQEIRLGDGMPDIGRVIGVWGQVILRGKEWRGDHIVVSGGVMVWALYAPEDGSESKCLDAWLPFKMKWDLGKGVKDGEIRISNLLKMVDGRSVSPRKIMLRAVVSASVQVMCPGETEIYMPPENVDGVELLHRTYPLDIYKEAGEKAFLSDEDLQMPNSGAKPEKILFSRFLPRIIEHKVLTGKLVFRGMGNLRILGRGDDRQLHVWDLDVPFSQVVQLQGEYSPEAQAELILGVTSLEPEMDTEGRVKVKCGMVAQYLVSDRELVCIAEDAYSPVKELEIHTKPSPLPAVLDRRMEMIRLDQKLPMDGMSLVWCDILPEHPRRRKTDTETILEFPGVFQLVCAGENGELTVSNVHWERELVLPVDADAWAEGEIQAGENAQISLGDGGLELQAQLPVNVVTTARNELPQITGLTLAGTLTREPGRPSLILRRAGKDTLWTIAKACGSSVSAIRRANDLTQEPEEDRMLLIPVI